MNISKISFGSSYNDGFGILNHPVQKNIGHTQLFSIKKAPEKDIFVNQQKVGKHEKKEPYEAKHLKKNSTPELPKNRQSAREYLENKKKKSAKKRTFISVAGGTLAGIMLAHGIVSYNQPAKLITVPANNYNNIYEIAEIYDCDVDAILAYNNLYNNSENTEEIKVPTMYDNLQGEIDNIQNKLYQKNLSNKERTNLENKMNKLKEKQALQKELATVYTDGKFVYFTINKFGSNSQSISGINVEDFKQIFDIKDKAIKDNNDIDFSWEYTAEEGGYKDYTQYILSAGETIKVPIGAIKTGSGINLD